LGKYKGIRSVTIYGGASYNDQIRGLRQGAPVVVGTPGRVIDHLERGTLSLENVNTLILDEADEMFSMGFKEELDTVLKGVSPENCNTWLFSATMSREVRRIVDDNLRSPQTVQVNRKEMLSAGVEQYFYRVNESDKPDIVCKLIEAADSFYGIIFCQTKALVSDLNALMANRGYKVDCLHGDKDQTSRERTMQAFRDRKIQVLICTDVAARGLDVKDVTHVVNYSLPRELENYVHRIGRTARSGKTGIVMNLVTFSHRQLIGRIEAHTKVPMKEGLIPTRREIGAKKVAKLLETFKDQPYHGRVLEVMGEEWKAQLATMTPEQVAGHFLALMMPEVFSGEQKPSRAHSRERSVSERERPGRSFDRASGQAPNPRSHQEFDEERNQRSHRPPLRSSDRSPERGESRTEYRGERRAESRGPREEYRGGSRGEHREKSRRENDPSREGTKHFGRADKKAKDHSVANSNENRQRNDDAHASAKDSAKAKSASPRSAKLSFNTSLGAIGSAASGAAHAGTPKRFGKLPKHPAGLSHVAQHGELPVMNRRARRAAMFGTMPGHNNAFDRE
jgi:ATP-dependent RNA helicase DeaD